MKSFDAIYGRALARKGEEALLARLPTVKSRDALVATSNDRFLSAMAKCVFAAGFRWRVVEAKWAGFEAAFEGFDPELVGGYGEETVAALRNDTRIIRNPQKIQASIENARFVMDVSDEHDGFGRFIADWPTEKITGLWEYLRQHGARLGGMTGPRMLRNVGKDTFIFSTDVVFALSSQGLITGKPTSKKAEQQALEAFLRWRDESGRPFAELSMILACSVDTPAQPNPSVSR